MWYTINRCEEIQVAQSDDVIVSFDGSGDPSRSTNIPLQSRSPRERGLRLFPQWIVWKHLVCLKLPRGWRSADLLLMLFQVANENFKRFSSRRRVSAVKKVKLLKMIQPTSNKKTDRRRGFVNDSLQPAVTVEAHGRNLVWYFQCLLNWCNLKDFESAEGSRRVRNFNQINSDCFRTMMMYF